MARVLIVDDDEFTCKFLKDALVKYQKVYYQSDWDLRIDTLTSAIRALEVIKENNYELIVTDILMAKMDGWELIRKLRNKFPQFKVPIVVISGVRGVDLEYEGAVHGVSAYFGKPISPKEFAHKVFNLIKCS